jgi:hypothetical protein
MALVQESQRLGLAGELEQDVRIVAAGAVPPAAVDEDRGPPAGQDDIRVAGRFFPCSRYRKPIAESSASGSLMAVWMVR